MFPLTENKRTHGTKTRVLSFVLCILLVWTFALPFGSSDDTPTAHAQTVEDIEQEVEDLKQEMTDLENEISNLEQEADDYKEQISGYEQDKDALAEEQAALEAQRQETAQSLEDQKAQSALLQQQIEKKGEEIAINLEMIALLEEKINQKTIEIAAQEAALITLEAQHAEQFELLGKRLRGISQGNSSVSVIQMLFNSESYTDYLVSFKLSERISQNAQSIMDTLDEIAARTTLIKQQNEADKAAQEQELAELDRVKQENEAAQEELRQFHAESEELAAQMEQDYAYLNEQIEQIDQKQATLESEIAKALEAQRQREEEAKRREEEQQRLEEEQQRLEEEQNRLEQEEQERLEQENQGDTTTPDEDEGSSDNEEDDNSSDNGGSYIQGVDGGMYWPTPTCTVITSSYKYRPQFGRWHYGIDIACYGSAMGRMIVPAASGTVIYSGWMSGYGYCLMIDHGYNASGNHILTLYGHCNALYASVGDYVTGGQTHIADVGNSGVSYGAHLHFEVRVNNSAVDPVSNGFISTSGVDILG